MYTFQSLAQSVFGPAVTNNQAIDSTPRSQPRRVFRVRRIPPTWTKDILRSSLLQAFTLMDDVSCVIYSLAQYHDLIDEDCWLAATISCEAITAQMVLQSEPGSTELGISLMEPSTSRSYLVTFDSHFDQFTPYSPSSVHENELEIIALHGYAGTAYGSWASKTGMMWLRDIVAEKHPHIKVWMYGYDTKLSKKDCTDLDTITRDLWDHLRRKRTLEQRAGQPTRPILFVCHSLGGIIFRKLMIEDKRRGQYDGEILSNTYGALTFGTPFDGWTNEVLVKTVDDDMHQSNLTRLRTDLDLGPREQELHAFMAAFNFSKTESEIHTFYETLKSPEYFWNKTQGQAQPSGNLILLVTRASATQGRPEDHGKGRGLNRQHNDLVKFHKRSDPHLVTVIQELERMAQAALQTVPARRRSRLTQVIEACPQTAQCLLRLLSFLDAVTIPMQLFIDGATQLDYEISMQIHESGLHRTNPHLSQLLDLIRDNEAFTQAIENLCDRNLMHRKDDFVKMFTKDQKLVCGCLGEHDFVIQFEIAVSLICSLTRLDSTTAYDVSSHIQRLLTTWKSTSTYNHRDGSKRAIVFLFSRSGKAHFMKGQLLIACEHHQQAKDLYTKCLGSEHPSSLAAYQDLARALLKNQKYSQAEEAFTAIYNIVIEAKRRRYDPIVLGARRDLANFYYIRKQPGDLEKAQKHIEAVIQLTKGLRRPDERNLADLKRSKDLFYNIQHERAQNTPVEDNRIHRSYKRTY